jgi:hypothetical protein
MAAGADGLLRDKTRPSRIPPLDAGECQGSCRLDFVTITPNDEAAAVAAWVCGEANLGLVVSVPRRSLRRRSGARQARAIGRAVRGCGWLCSSHLLRGDRRGLGVARSGRESRFTDRTGKRDL